MKFLTKCFLFVSLLLLPVLAHAQDPAVLLFVKQGCPHCADAESFLHDLKNQGEQFTLTEYEVSTTAGHRLYEQYQNQYHFPSSVPIILISPTGDFSQAQVIVGYHNADDSGQSIQKALAGQTVATDADTCSINEASTCETSGVSTTVNIPFLGMVDLTKFSLPVMTTIIGLADGFNPCAMWALVALLGFLLTQQSRRRLVVIGGAFVLTSYLFSWFVLLGWYKAFHYIDSFSGLVMSNWWVALEYLILLLALVIGYNLIRSGMRPEEESCPLNTRQAKIRSKLAKLSNTWWPLAIILAALLAIFVNLIEMVCSIGLPVVFTSQLNSMQVSAGAAYGYITLYTIWYMLDDLLVFIGAVILARVITVSPRLSRVVKIAAGVILILIIVTRILQV